MKTKLMWISIVAILLGCASSPLPTIRDSGVTAPKAIELAATVVNVTDKALSTVILLTTPGTDEYQGFIPAKDALKKANESLKKANAGVAESCSAVREASVIGEIIGCDQCTKLGNAAAEFLCKDGAK